MDPDKLRYSEYCSLGPHSHMTDSEDEGQEDAKPEEKEAEPASPPVQSHEPVSPLAGGEPGIPQPQRTARSPSLFAHRHSMVGKRPLSPLVPRDSIVDVDYDAPPSPRSQAVDQAVVMDFDMHQLAMDVNLAARFGDVEQLKHLLLRGADLQVKDYDNRSPLHVAASEGQLNVVEFLLGQDIDVNAVDRWGNTPLEDAINNAHFEVAQLIRENGGTAKHEMGDRLCEYAASGDLGNIEALVQAGTNINSRSTRSKHTMLHMAAAEGHMVVVKWLLNHGADVDILDRWGNSPLKNALDAGHKEVAEMLRQSGAKDFSNDTEGFELNKAAALGELHKVKALVEWRGIDVNRRDYDGRTALLIAASEGRLDVVQYLVSKGADIEIKDRWGFNAYQNALQNGHPEIAEFLNHSAVFVMKTELSVDDPEAKVPAPEDLQLVCCRRFGRNRPMIHKIFGKLLRQIGDTGGWEFAEFWAINQEYRVLQFCPESCNINDHGNEALHKRLYNFEKVSAGLLIEYNIFFGGSVLTKRRPAWFDHLHRLPQFNFFRSPMCRVAGLKTCLALPISPGEQSDEVFGAVVLFTTEELEPRQEIVEPLMDKITMVARLATAYAKQPKNLIPMHTYANLVTDAIRQSLAAKEQAEGLRLDYLPIILDIGMLDPVFQWALSMNSEEHRACIEVLKAIAEAAPLMAGYEQWPAILQKLERSLYFLVSVSPAGRKETPVKGIAEEALAALGQAPGVALLSPPYFLHQDSPVMDQLRNVKYTLRSEYQEFCKHHDMQRARVEDPSRREFKWSMATSDVFRCFGKHEVAGNKPTYGNMYGNKPQKQGPSECDKVSKCITHVMEEKGLDASYFLNQDTLLELHNCLELDKKTVQGSYRTAWVVGSFQFYKFYRVFSPYEEIPRAIEMMLHDLNVEMKDWDGVVRAFYTYHAFVHYIHPFADGNGRLSRLLANIVLKSAGYLGVLTYQDKVLNFDEFLKRVLTSGDSYNKMRSS